MTITIHDNGTTMSISSEAIKDCIAGMQFVSIDKESRWHKAACEYAGEIVDTYDYTVNALNESALETALLNGASDWVEYSMDGRALIETDDIANRLCGTNDIEDPLIKQGMNLYYAFALIWAAVQTLTESAHWKLAA